MAKKYKSRLERLENDVKYELNEILECMIHNDEERRKNYRKRHQIYLKEGYYSLGFFSFNYLW